MRKYLKWVLTVAVLLWCVFIWQFSTATGEASSATSGGVVDFCNQVLQSAGVKAEITGNTVRKTAHFLEFFVLGVLAAATLLAHGFRHWLFLSPVPVLLVAAIDECIQIFVPGRGPHVLDVLLDFAGGLCGILLFFLAFTLISYIINKRKEKNKEISKTS